MSATIQYESVQPAEPESEPEEVVVVEVEVFDPFDPSEHTVVEVNEYLDNASATERVRVLAAERDGKNRKSVGL